MSNVGLRTSSQNIRRQPATPLAFTLMELSMGLVITALVLGALAAVSVAMSKSMTATTAITSQQVHMRQSDAQLARLISSAKYIGLASDSGVQVASSSGPVSCHSGSCSCGGCGKKGGCGCSGCGCGDCSVASKVATSIGAALMLWYQDTNSDGVMQMSEMALIQQDMTAKELRLYTIPATATCSPTVCHFTDMDDSGDVANFKSNSAITSRTIASAVTAVSFTVSAPAGGSQRQSVDYAVTFTVDGAATTQNQSVTLKAQGAKP